MSRVGRPLADSFSVNKEQLAADAEELASLVNRPVYAVVGLLRWLADQYESDATLASEALDRQRQVVDSEAERFESAIAPVLVCRGPHCTHGHVGTSSRLARMVFRSGRARVVNHQDSSTRGRLDSARDSKVEVGARGGHDSSPRADAPLGGVA